uniref:Uncharacterized protein n=1 Tax=Chrysotila carterae TaxID=13221 RepID=A0A7S4FA81_CHRCT|mmetsp:Transcript_26689/g.58551  ORF Transcript_26689/g.58551 Transcript_26689/m.58551 type:complete len:311 (+) Transcript_26689:294-1226(+)
MIRARTLLLVGLTLLAASKCSALEEEPFISDDDQFDEEEDHFDDSGEPFWSDLANRVQRSVDSEGLLRARRWGNIVNGVLLGATGPVTFLVSMFSMRLSSAVLSIYLTAMGATLAALELGFAPIAPWVQENLHYLSTPRGHTALISIAGGLTWTFGKAGLLPAVLTCANAVFNGYFPQILSFIADDDNQQECGFGDDQLPPFESDGLFASSPPHTSSAQHTPPREAGLEQALRDARKQEQQHGAAGTAQRAGAATPATMQQDAAQNDFARRQPTRNTFAGRQAAAEEGAREHASTHGRNEDGADASDDVH